MANGPAAFTPENAAVLAAVSYIDPSDQPAQQLADMTTALGTTSLPTAGQWQIVWGPADLGGNLMYIAQVQGAGVGERGSQVAVVIRGTIFDFPTDLLQDTEVATQVPLPFPPPKGFSEKAAISFGASEAWLNLAKMLPSIGGSSVDAFQFLKALPGPVSVLVTGHSLGGQLATVAAVWIAGFLSSAAVQVITFAAPTAGNPDFQSSFDSRFSGTAVRYFTDLDIVPRLWVPTGDYDLDSIKQLFPGGPQCDLGCHTGVATAEGIVKNVTYAQPTAVQMLTSAVYSEGILNAFDDEVSAQHRMLLYLYLLGGTSASIIQQVFDSSWSPPPGM